VPPTDDVRQFEARLAREPSSQAYAALAEAYRRAGRLAEAVETSRAGLSRFPDYTTARLVLARALLDRDDAVTAARELERFIEREPDHEPALRLAVECALRNADPRGALRHLRRIVVLDPQDRGAQGQLRALEVAAGEAAGLAPEAGGLWGLLADDTFVTATFGDLCVAQGLLDEATAVFGRLVLRDGNDDIARARLAELGRGRAQGRRMRG
jgi:tetratricopeptide (TPR) repeat protein